MPMIPTIDTPRLRLRPYRLQEFDAYAAMWAEPAVTRFIGGTAQTRDYSWSRFLRQIGLWHYLGFGFFAIEDRETGSFIGECGFHDLQRPLSPSLDGTMEAGWALIGAMQGKGLAVEAMRAALGWADVQHPTLRQTAMIDPGHAASLHVAGKLGFTEFARSTFYDKPMVLLERRRPEAG